MRRELWPILAGSILGVALGLRLGKKKATDNPLAEAEKKLCTPVLQAQRPEPVAVLELIEVEDVELVEALFLIFLRSAPSINAGTLRTVPQGKRMVLLEEVVGESWEKDVLWGKVSVDGEVGYIYNYMKYTHSVMRSITLDMESFKTSKHLQA